MNDGGQGMKKIKSGQDMFKHLLVFCGCVFCILFITFTQTSAQAQSDPPYVVSTNPAHGAIGVSADIKNVYVTFSKSMNTKTSYNTNNPAWGLGPPQWSADSKILTLVNHSTSPLPKGIVLEFTLFDMKDKEGNLLRHPGFWEGSYKFSFTMEYSDDDPPIVISTSPANGTRDISRNLERVVVNFNKAMNTSHINMTTNFPSFSISWSNDNRSLYLIRADPDTPLSAGMPYTFTLNPFDGNNFRDTQGNILPKTNFSFTTIADYDYELIKVPANYAKGFDWPYYFAIPNDLSSPTTLLVEPNNTGTWSNDLSVHESSALNLLRWRADFAVKLKVPLLVPTFPRPFTPEVPGGIYTHALDWYSLNTDYSSGSIERIDLQLIAMIRDAQEKLRAMEHIDNVDSKIFMMGFSASGAFTSRFTALHPHIIRASASGSGGGWPLAPLANWQGKRLGYPVGIAGLADLIGKPFDLATLRKVPQYIYVGDQDQNDALDTRVLPEDEKKAICDWLDCEPLPYISKRWPYSREIYESVQANAQFVIYPGVAHTITRQMFDDVQNFFESHKPEKTKALPGVLMLLLDEEE
jgi:dienelactone hydrolase